MSNHTAWMAISYLRAGLSVFPLAENSKRPAGSWEQYQRQLASIGDASAWQCCNLGIATGEISGVVVVDCESEANAAWFLKYRAAGLTPGMVATPRGIHLYFRHPGQRVPNITHARDEAGISRYDIRGDGGYVVAPPSTVSGKQYTWLREFLDAARLPEFRMSWRPGKQAEKQAEKQQQPTGLSKQATTTTDRAVTDGEAYIMRIHAVSGQGGHGDTWRAVNRLKDSGISEAEAYEVLSRWNSSNAEPPWSEAELLHKIKDCFSR